MALRDNDYEQLSKQLADHEANMDIDGSSPTPTFFSTPYPPTLHVCDEENGYGLRDLEDFCHIHKMCLLSLLRTLQLSLFLTSEQDYEDSKQQQHQYQQQHQQQTQEQAGKMSSSESVPSSLTLLQRRIDIAILYMLQFFTMADLECILQSPSDVDMKDYDDGFMPSLRSQDFAKSDMERIMQTTTSDGRILGPLMQRNTRTAVRPSTPSLTGLGLAQWLCPHHAQVHCRAQAREHLKAVILKNGGSCVEQERSAEVQFKTRERATEFYRLVLEFQCIVKLKIQIGWKDLTEDDLWELAEVVTESNIGDLTLDCYYESESGDTTASATAATATTTAENSMDHQQRTNLSFKPFLGMLFSPNLTSFTLENFSGLLPTLDSSNFTYSPTTFTLQGFRQSEAMEYNLPSFSNLRSLVLNRCGPELKAQRLTELIRHCPLLTEIQLECDNIDASTTQINEATNQMENMTYLKLNESLWESVEMTFAKTTTGQNNRQAKSVLQRVNRKTQQTLDIEPQYAGALERLATCSFMNLWESHQTTLSNIIAQNPRLHSLELMCEARSMDRLWRFLTSHYQHHQQVRLQSQTSADSTPFLRLHLYDGSCSLLTITPIDNALTLHAYTPQHRQLLQSLEDIAVNLGIGTKFDCAEQLALLQSHAEQDGGLRFESLSWFLTPKKQNDPAFLLQLRSLIAANPQLKGFSIRVYVMLFDISSLIQIWNWIVGDAYLNEGEHGRWIQACFEHSSHKSYNEFKSTSGSEGGATISSSTTNNNNNNNNNNNDNRSDSRNDNNDYNGNGSALTRKPDMEITASVRDNPDHGIIQTYTLHLDEDKDLVLSSSHFYFSSMISSAVTGARTAMTIALSLARR
ncbi:hypothetical protein BGX20_000696 [Mortierella sp. AD010]|nr:hypothetical protein BGX20_000696 [Mortierella sp. AD010]